uniref:mucin-13b n=1 Tax=Scatophagus argus TaxID=75038 RepID=UPI001ED82AF8|nr:mucin-13b [Scatophagus argus]
MARDFKLIFVLCLIAACLGGGSDASTTVAPSATTSGGSTVSTTVAPSATTSGGSTVSTTVAPSATTSGGSTVSTTVAPSATISGGSTVSTTVAPSATTSGGSTVSTTVAPSATTSGGSTVSATASPTETTEHPTQPSNPCVPNPCGQGSTCEPRANPNFVCLCLPGESYNHDTKRCENAKVFPGALSLPGLTYTDNMKDNTSPQFLEAAKTITDELDKVFKNNSGYSGSTVLKIEPISSTRVWSRAEPGVTATVEISFNANADISSDQILKDIQSYANHTGGLLTGVGFKGKFIYRVCLSDIHIVWCKEEDLCGMGACDSNSTTCSSGNGSFICTCKDTYVRTKFSTRVCTACPSGQKAVNSKCVNCPFGYSGFNCDESWQLTVVIVGSVLGGLLLITLILLPIVACKSSKKKNTGVKKPYESHSVAGAPLVQSSSAERQSAFGNGSSFANVGVPRIPRAAPTSSWDRRNNLEMTPSNSQQNLVSGGRNAVSMPLCLFDIKLCRILKHLYEDADKVTPYGRPQPQINPYAQNRPQINPYATSLGHTNNSYLQDNGRRFN